MPQPYIPWTGYRSPRKYSSWELESKDFRAIPGWGLLLTAERQAKGILERIVVENACGGKPDRHGSKAVLLSHA